MTAPPQVLLILGLPYSGSTLLAALLGNAPGIENASEVNFLENDYHADKICTCGARITDCVFWPRLIARLEADAAAGQPTLTFTKAARSHPIDARRKGARVRLAQLLGRPPEAIFGTEEMARYGAAHTHFFASWAALTGARTVVDASKSAGRLDVLARFGALDLRVVWLSRAPLAAFAARLKRARRRNRFYVQALAPYYLVLQALQRRQARKTFETVPPARRLTLSFEALLADPAAAEAALSDLLGRNATDPVRFGLAGTPPAVTLEPQHGYAGNVWRIGARGEALTVTLEPGRASDPLGWFERLVARAGGLG